MRGAFGPKSNWSPGTLHTRSRNLAPLNMHTRNRDQQFLANYAALESCAKSRLHPLARTRSNLWTNSRTMAGARHARRGTLESLTANTQRSRQRRRCGSWPSPFRVTNIHTRRSLTAQLVAAQGLVSRFFRQVRKRKSISKPSPPPRARPCSTFSLVVPSWVAPTIFSEKSLAARSLFHKPEEHVTLLQSALNETPREQGTQAHMLESQTRTQNMSAPQICTDICNSRNSFVPLLAAENSTLFSRHRNACNASG